MVGVSVQVELNEQEKRDQLRELVERMENPAGFYKNVGAHMIRSTHINFERETAPSGIPWQKLMPKTIARRKKRGRAALKILRETGVLKGSISARASREQVAVGTPVVYAAIHQLGGKIEKPERHAVIYRHKDEKTGKVGNRFRTKKDANLKTKVTIPAHTINIPARPFLGISKDDESEIINIAQNWLHSE